MRKVFDEAIQKFDNVETFILIVADEKKQLCHMEGKCKKAFGQLMVESDEAMEIFEVAIATAKVQIKINELIAAAEKQGIALSGMDDEAEVEVEAEKE